MSLAEADFSEFDPAPEGVAPAAPPEALVLAPTGLEEAARVLDAASERRAPVLVWGGGTHQGLGHRVAADVVLSTARLDRVVAWEPDDLTLVVEAGARVAQVEEMLATQRQTAGLPESGGEATVGGVVATGVSGYRRGRYGPTRDRVLEVTLVTGDGRIVRGGGRVVKNVSGYDLPRLATGAFGALGLIGLVCLKLWPLPERQMTVPVDDPATAWRRLYRPLAVLETESASHAFLQGVDEDLRTQARRVGSDPVEGHHWPDRPVGTFGLSLRVPPALTPEAVKRVPSGWRFVAQHGVGEVSAAGDDLDLDEAVALRGWCESHDGAVVVTTAPADLYDRFDPWGAPPAGLALQRRIIAGFDPLRVVNPGRLPGGL